MEGQVRKRELKAVHARSPIIPDLQMRKHVFPEAFRTILDCLPWPAMLIDESGVVEHVNQAMRNRGIPPLGAGNSALRSLLPRYYEALHGETPWLTEQDAEVVVQSTGASCHERLCLRRLPEGACLIVIDQTRLRELEIGNAQTARLASLGFMLASVCHEVNNPLSTINSIVTILQSKRGVSAEVRDKGLATIANSVNRLLAITRKLNLFGRVSDEVLVDFEVDRAIEEASVQLTYDSLGETVRLDHRRNPNAIVHGHPSQLQQVFFNIFLNATQAMKGNGSITVVTQCVAQAQVQVSICDSGPGLPQEHLAAIFEPFFTTKASGKGTGLGLAITNEIIHEHRGRIRAENHPAGGACFILELPLANAKGE